MTTKTYKREVAIACIVGVFVLAWFEMLSALAILAPLVFLFATAAFGLDWASRQTGLTKGKPEDK
tara:strand:+ start:48 stop:242 length:195 start_codon:yes stop_codon:yes gene_type:complete